MTDVTHILKAMHDGNPAAAEQLLPRVYEELRKLAAARMASQPADHTLQPTALVHEAYLKLLGDGSHSWNDRRHFFAAAAEAMRHVLVDATRRKAAVKHGGHASRKQLDLEHVVAAGQTTDENILAIHTALGKLAAQDAQAAELVKLRFFAGLTFPQSAEILGLSERTAKRLWTYARAWLYRELQNV
jgi:RNA polymerase sigma factor (TIGR02999 family)